MKQKNGAPAVERVRLFLFADARYIWACFFLY